jgi:hypothetical protein
MRAVEVHLTVRRVSERMVKVIERLGADSGKPVTEAKTGVETYRATGRDQFVQRHIRCARGWYDEMIRDAESGEIVHECHEPLSDHQNHGDAKRPRLKKRP